MAIGAIGSSGGFDVSQMASKMAASMVKNLDTSGDGSIDKAEFVKGLTAKGVSADQAGKRFDAIDTKHTGTISQGDIEASIKAKAGQKSPSAGGPPKGGPPAGGAPAGGAPAGSAATSSTKTYDKKDANKDGTVSATEEMIYQLSHVDPSSAGTKKTSAQKVGQNVDVMA